MNPLKLWTERRRGGLLENTIMLYILQFSNMALGLVSRGYQTRVLSKEIYGTLDVAQSVMQYFQLFLDFGFILSATAKVSTHRDDKEYLCRILTSIVIAKVIILAASIAILSIFFAPNLSAGDFAVYLIYLIATAFNSLLPDYMYRGLEKMSIITMRAVSVKTFATFMLFIFMKGDSDFYMVPLFLMIGNLGALFTVYWHLIKKLGIHFVRVVPKEVLGHVRDSLWFFLSGIASTVYGAANTQILALAVDPTKVLSATYGSANTIIATGKNAMSPISDSLYPHMMKERNFKLIKKALLMFMPIILAGCTIVFIFAEPICVIAFGQDYASSAVPLRALIPVAVFAFPNFILGYSTLGPMGLSKFVNISVIAGTAFHIVGMGILYLSGNLGMVSICLMTGCTELFILLFRITVILRNRKLLRPAEEETAPEEDTKN